MIVTATSAAHRPNDRVAGAVIADTGRETKTLLGGRSQIWALGLKDQGRCQTGIHFPGLDHPDPLSKTVNVTATGDDPPSSIRTLIVALTTPAAANRDVCWHIGIVEAAHVIAVEYKQTAILSAAVARWVTGPGWSGSTSTPPAPKFASYWSK